MSMRLLRYIVLFLILGEGLQYYVSTQAEADQVEDLLLQDSAHPSDDCNEAEPESDSEGDSDDEYSESDNDDLLEPRPTELDFSPSSPPSGIPYAGLGGLLIADWTIAPEAHFRKIPEALQIHQHFSKRSSDPALS